LGVIILLDRISFFNAHVKKFFQLSAYKISAIAFAACFLIDIPYYFVFVPDSETVRLSQTRTFTIWFSNTSPFAVSALGKALTFIVYGLRDFLVMIIEIAVNLVSVYMLKRYLNKKMKRHRSCIVEASTSAATTPKVTSTSINPSELRAELISKSDPRATLMAIIMYVLSVVNHIFMSACVVYPYFAFNLNVFILHLVSDIMQPAKCCLDFLLFFYFNKVCRRVFFKYLRLKQ
jgi:hypothetical protein